MTYYEDEPTISLKEHETVRKLADALGNLIASLTDDHEDCRICDTDDFDRTCIITSDADDGQDCTMHSHEPEHDPDRTCGKAESLLKRLNL